MILQSRTKQDVIAVNRQKVTSRIHSLGSLELNISTEAGSSQGQAAAFFRLLNRHKKPPLSWQDFHATESPTESPSSGQKGLPASHGEVTAPVQWGRGGLGEGHSFILVRC